MKVFPMHVSGGTIKASIFLLVAVCVFHEAQGRKPAGGVPQDRIGKVEHGLCPPFPRAGAQGWALSDRMRFYKVQGLSIAVIDDGEIAWARGYGYADTLARRPVTAQTLFQAASISKAVTAAAALRLAQDGRLNLDAPVNTVMTSWRLPEYAAGSPPVTMKHLLTHMGGITVSGFLGYPQGDPVPGLPEILDGKAPANNAAIRADTTAGAVWRYSGGGYTVLQQALVDAAGEAFPELLRRTVLEPFGMTLSTFEQPLPAGRARDAATPYALVEGFDGRTHVYPELAAAGLWTTPVDLARFYLGVIRSLNGASGAPLERRTAEAILRPAYRDFSPWDRSWTQPTYWQFDQGIGFRILSRTGARDEMRYMQHNGLNAGFLSWMIGSADGRHGAVVMINGQTQDGLLQEVLRSVAKAYGWRDFFLKDSARIVSFSLEGHPEAKAVTVAGNFNDWNGDELSLERIGGRWLGRFELPPGRYQYKLIVDGQWISDPANDATHQDGSGNVNSVLIVK
jgi:CubicO group peptidase (beta-lactamase class C family)